MSASTSAERGIENWPVDNGDRGTLLCHRPCDGAADSLPSIRFECSFAFENTHRPNVPIVTVTIKIDVEVIWVRTSN
jgi:hypothetical protein